MGFINTKYTDAVDSMVKSSINIINNPLYIFNDKPATVVDYYNKDINESTLDEVSGLEYNTIGLDCPTKFNKIKDALLYGIERISTNYTYDEEDGGTFADDISGDAYVLPNTFVPQIGDYFEIKYIKEQQILFIVNEVQKDTLDNGYNFYKISYKVKYEGKEAIKELNDLNVTDTYRMLTSTIGTNRISIIQSDDYDLLAVIEANAKKLKEYFKQLFFNPSIQTFTYMLKDSHMYDPFLIEFIIRNKLLSGTDEYVYVDHAMSVWKTFGIDYDHTFFRALEDKSKKIADNCKTIGVGILIEDMMSLMTTKLEDYYYVDYNVNKYAPFLTRIETIPNELIDCIINNSQFGVAVPKFYNLVLNYFKDDYYIKDEDLDVIDHIELNDAKDIFYGIPMLIFVLERFAENIVKRLDE